MPDDDQTAELLREIRDLLAQQKQTYKENLAQAEATYEATLLKARRQSIATRVLQWGALFVIIYGAVFLALQNAQ
jgi:hypothetical protein